MSGGRAKRRKQKAWRKTHHYLKTSPICVNCGEPGPHFIPPGFGSPGMFMCKTGGVS